MCLLWSHFWHWKYRVDCEIRYMQRRNYKPLTNVPAIKMSSTSVSFFVLLWPESHPFILQNIDQMLENYKCPAPFTLVYRPICISPVNLIIIRFCNAVTLTHWLFMAQIVASSHPEFLCRHIHECSSEGFFYMLPFYIIEFDFSLLFSVWLGVWWRLSFPFASPFHRFFDQELLGIAYYTLVFVMLLKLETNVQNTILNYFVFAYRKTSKSCFFLKKQRNNDASIIPFFL